MQGPQVTIAWGFSLQQAGLALPPKVSTTVSQSSGRSLQAQLASVWNGIQEWKIWEQIIMKTTRYQKQRRAAFCDESLKKNPGREELAMKKS